MRAPCRHPNDSFVHLHVHTDYSMLDGAARVKPAHRGRGCRGHAGHRDDRPRQHVRRLRLLEDRDGRRASSRSSAPRPTSRRAPHRSDKTRVRWGDQSQQNDDVGGSGAYTHMTLLAENNEGMHNLFRCRRSPRSRATTSSRAWTASCSSRYSKGVIATTGCVGGEVQTRLRLGQYDEARKAAAEFQDIFGKENFFAEIADHGIDIERRTMGDLLQARQGARHAAGRHQRPALHARARRGSARGPAVRRSASTLDDPNRFKFDADEYYLKSAAEMRQHVPRSPRRPCDNTLLIAERCEVSFEQARPHAAVPGARGRDRGELVREGGRRRG